ncbi:type VI secretion system Vgr family protein [Cupriavidus taiwanensis]|uniref:Replication/virulence associated protein Vgr-related n=1 Tax=Cupriavidus taiwanensis (strain DSM 17343 / BCRC 17206 / CCUG 44338 / CIP 107171 / LMG 19424 / R1) TaxID=977880 RepID=B3R2R3_CUPTR|nr:type VI secretion system Vgr family protein [Cupriavidus taiwanensis]CAQ68594.1 replication/virulence associated protein; Vgr-related [Cupriavidus taiwanensis LMG 19424]
MSALNNLKNLAVGRNRTVSVSSAAIPDLLGQPQLEFVRISGHEGLSELFTYKVDLRAVSPAAEQYLAETDPDAMIGREMTVTIELDGMGTGLLGGVGPGHREITGVISDIEHVGGVAENRMYRFTLRPWLWLATQTSDFKPFQKKTVIEILDEVLADYPFSVEKRLDTSVYPKLDWEVQHGETDAHFIQRLTEEYGITYFFEHDGGHHRLILAAESGAYRAFPSEAYRTLPLYPRGFKIDQEHLVRFDPVNRLRTGKVTLNDYDPRKPRADLTTGNSQPRDTSFADFERYEYPGDYIDPAVGEMRARIRMEERRSRGRRARGVGALRGVAAGCTYLVSNHSNPAMNREYLVTGATLDLEDVGGESGSGQQFSCRVAFEAHPTDEVFRPPRTVGKPYVAGVQRAVVTGPKNQEIWCNDHGNVIIQFEWDRYGKYDENSSPWIRVVNGWSGDQFGAMHIPRIGQEVIVAFINGDPDCPVIVGRAPNQLNLPPWALPGQHALSGIRSKELFGGRHNHLLLDDTQDQIQAQLSSDHQASQLNLGYLTGVPDHAGRKDRHGEGFDLRTDGHGTIRGAKGLFVTAEGQVGAMGGHLSRDEFIRCMEAALEAAKSLGDYGHAHEGLAADTDPQAELVRAVREWDAGANNRKDAPGEGGRPLIGAYAPAGMALATPKILTTYAGKHIDTVSRLNQQMTAGQQFVVNAGQGIGFFAHSGELRGIAHQGNLVLQAQKSSIEANAWQNVVVTATDGNIVLNAGKSLSLMTADGAGIRIGGGKVEIHGPGGIVLHTSDFDIVGPSRLSGPLPQFSQGEAGRKFLLKAGELERPVANAPYQIVKADGTVVEGVTNAAGETAQSASELIEAVSVKIFAPKLY